MKKHIVILGGSHAGISTAHRILKGDKKGDVKITLVSPNTHHYWNVASPRAIIPGELTDDQLFRPIAPGFAQYGGRFEFVATTAESVDFDTRRVQVRGSGEGAKKIDYDFLILATGSKTVESTPFKVLESTESTKAALHELQERVGKAKSIVVAGSGVTGIEIAGELGEKYGKEKDITLATSGSVVLEEAPASVQQVSTKKLESLGIKVRPHARIVDAVKGPNGKYELRLKDGSTLTTDLYIPAFGITPNSLYVPKKYLNPDGFVMVNEYQRVKGADNVWALGDVADLENAQLKNLAPQATHLAKNITLILANKPPVPYKAETSPFVGFSIGKSFGTAYWSTWRLPSFLITWLRKTLFVENLEPMVDGSAFK